MTTRVGRLSTARPLRIALAQIVALALLVGLVECVLFVGSPEGPYGIIVTITLVGWVYVACGVYAWNRRPGNRIGPLLCAGGFVWLVAALVNTTYPAFVAAGNVVATVVIAVVIHALLAFPSGRLRDRGPRALTVLGYVTTIVGNSPVYLLNDLTVAGTNPLRVGDDPTLYQLGRTLGGVAMAVAVIGTSIVLGRRLRDARPSTRRVLAPLYLYGIVAVVVVAFAGQLVRFVDLGPYTIFLVQIGLLAGIPVAFASGVLRGAFARTVDVEELGAWLGAGERGRDELGPALARAVGDPSLLLVFCGDDGWIDGDGLPVEPAHDRAVEVVRIGDRTVGAIVYDPLLAEPDLVRDVGRVVAVAVDRDRLTAQLLAGQEQLRISRARLVQAGDRERRRLAQDLHDRLQGRLVLVALRAGQLPGGDAVERLREDLDDALTEMRRVVQGVMPAVLLERGLLAAVEDMAERAPVPTEVQVSQDDEDRARLPETVEGTAYLVLSEVLTNAVKHADASRVWIGLHRRRGVLHLEIRDDGVGGAEPAGGAGLRGIADRVGALDGTLRITSPARSGTRIEVTLPCAS